MGAAYGSQQYYVITYFVCKLTSSFYESRIAIAIWIIVSMNAIKPLYQICYIFNFSNFQYVSCSVVVWEADETQMSSFFRHSQFFVFNNLPEDFFHMGIEANEIGIVPENEKIFFATWKSI